MDFAKVYGVAAAAGVASHVLYFHRAEHHKDAFVLSLAPALVAFY